MSKPTDSTIESQAMRVVSLRPPHPSSANAYSALTGKELPETCQTFGTVALAREEASTMKITVRGDTTAERLMNLTKRIVAVPNSKIDEQAKRYDEKKKRRLRVRRTAR